MRRVGLRCGLAGALVALATLAGCAGLNLPGSSDAAASRSWTCCVGHGELPVREAPETAPGRRIFAEMTASPALSHWFLRENGVPDTIEVVEQVDAVRLVLRYKSGAPGRRIYVDLREGRWSAHLPTALNGSPLVRTTPKRPRARPQPPAPVAASEPPAPVAINELPATATAPPQPQPAPPPEPVLPDPTPEQEDYCPIDPDREDCARLCQTGDFDWCF
ncbi:MAG: hypothetical protein MJE66_04140 [Proteobacteria bacterium]|nr:hypothetical protein [Pseudomonadota bacterium]